MSRFDSVSGGAIVHEPQQQQIRPWAHCLRYHTRPRPASPPPASAGQKPPNVFVFLLHFSLFSLLRRGSASNAFTDAQPPRTSPDPRRLYSLRRPSWHTVRPPRTPPSGSEWFEAPTRPRERLHPPTKRKAAGLLFSLHPTPGTTCSRPRCRASSPSSLSSLARWGTSRRADVNRHRRTRRQQ